MLAMLCSAVFLKLDYILKAVIMVTAVTAYIAIMHYPKHEIFDDYDTWLLFNDTENL